MKKGILILFILAAASLFFYIRFAGISWKSLYMLFLANGFGVCFFSIFLSIIGGRVARKSGENIDKRIQDYRQQNEYL